MGLYLYQMTFIRQRLVAMGWQRPEMRTSTAELGRASHAPTGLAESAFPAARRAAIKIVRGLHATRALTRCATTRGQPRNSPGGRKEGGVDCCTRPCSYASSLQLGNSRHSLLFGGQDSWSSRENDGQTRFRVHRGCPMSISSTPRDLRATLRR